MVVVFFCSTSGAGAGTGAVYVVVVVVFSVISGLFEQAASSGSIAAATRSAFFMVVLLCDDRSDSNTRAPDGAMSEVLYRHPRRPMPDSPAASCSPPEVAAPPRGLRGR